MRALALLFLVACGEPAVPTKAEVDCGAPIAGLPDVLAKHRVILVGEMHGTAEIPRAVGDIVCEASARGPVVLAVEHNVGLEPAYRAALETGDRSALLGAGLFASKRPEDQDGRASVAMADLLVRVPALRAAGRDVSVAVFSDPSPKDRDALMAKHFEDIVAAHGSARIVALTGNLHAKKTVGAPWDPAFVTMASEIVKRTPAFSIHAHGSGEAWNCQDEECAAHPLQALWGEPRRTIAKTEIDGYDAALNLGPVTASPPAASAK